jgi:hypothetical protein
MAYATTKTLKKILVMLRETGKAMNITTIAQSINSPREHAKIKDALLFLMSEGMISTSIDSGVTYYGLVIDIWDSR